MTVGEMLLGQIQWQYQKTVAETFQASEDTENIKMLNTRIQTEQQIDGTHSKHKRLAHC